MSDWRKACTLSQLRDDEALGVEIDAQPIAIARFEGRCYAVHDICTHAYAKLSGGFLEGERLYCPLHGAAFDLRDGRCLEGPAEEPVRSYPVRVEGDEVYVDVAPPDGG